MDLRFHSAVLFTQEIRQLKEFYEIFLGQVPEEDYGNCVIFKGGFTIWKLEKEYPVSRELGYRYDHLGNRNMELCFETDTFGTVVEHILSADLRILHNVTEEEWGQYTIRFFDPEGNLVEIGESPRCFVGRMASSGMDIDAIAMKTGLAEPLVTRLLKA